MDTNPTNEMEEMDDSAIAAVVAAIAADEMLAANITARFASERSGRGADGWERF